VNASITLLIEFKWWKAVERVLKCFSSYLVYGASHPETLIRKNLFAQKLKWRGIAILRGML